MTVPEGWIGRAKRAHLNMIENLLPFAALVLVAHVTGAARYAGKRIPTAPQQLYGLSAAAASFICAVPVLFGFIVPAAVLVELAAGNADARFGPRLSGLVINTFTLAGVAAIAAVAVALLLAYALHPSSAFAKTDADYHSTWKPMPT